MNAFIKLCNMVQNFQGGAPERLVEANAIICSQASTILYLRGKAMTTLVKNQSEQLFTELKPEEASVIEGGGLLFASSIHFDTRLTSRQFTNAVGSTIQVNLATRGTGKSNPWNLMYDVTLQRFQNGGWTNASTFKNLLINGSAKLRWSGLRVGDKLRLVFNDQADGKFVTGNIAVYD